MRKFLVLVFSLVLLLAPGFNIPIQVGAEEIPNPYESVNQGEEILFSHISDEHIKPSETLNIDRLTSTLKSIRGIGVPLLISTGDLTDDNRPESYAQYRKILSSVGGYSYFNGPTQGIAFKPVAGNHDYWGINPYPEYMGPVEQSFTLGNYRFIGFSGNPNSSLPLEGMEAEMQKSLVDGKYIVVYHHYPPYGWNYGMFQDPWEKLHALFLKYPVIAYLCGHSHGDQMGIAPPDIFVHVSGRAPAAYSTLYALTHGRINYVVKPSAYTPTIMTYPYQYYQGLEFTKTPAALTKVRAYATTPEQYIKRVYYQIDNNTPVTMARIGSTPYYEAQLDARNVNGPYTLKVVAEHSYGAWANGTHQINVYFAASSTVPVINQVSPSSGKAGDVITIYGSNFGANQGNSYVKFGSTSASVTSWSDTQIQATAPSGSGPVSVTVTTSAGMSNGVQFQYAAAALPFISSISPTSGKAGDTVTINGSNFGATQGTSSVKFGSTTASVTSWSDTKIQVKAPSGSGTVSVSVTTSAGTSNGVQFQYVAVALPNLIPYKPSGWSDKIVVSKTTGTTTDSTVFYSTDTLYMDWAVINSGPGTVEKRFCSKLYVDNVGRATWYKDPPLRQWYDTKVLDYNIGKLSPGTHKIMILTDCSNVVPEVSESDNTYTKTITVK